MDEPGQQTLNEQNSLPHKLAAILYADVEGYSRLTGADEAGTHRTLSAYLDLFAETIKAHHGEVKHYAGDAVLADFTTVSDALNCAISLQKTMKEKNETVAQDKRMQFRIGLNLGEVIVDRGEVYGNGVNVAARLETLAEPGGICVSGNVVDAVGAKLPLRYEYMGEHRVKNIDKPVRAYRVSEASLGPTTSSSSIRRWLRVRRKALIISAVVLIALLATLSYFQFLRAGSDIQNATLPAFDKPSIAVLPFDDLSGDSKESWLSEGMTQTLISDLSRLRNLYVIARNSVLTYKDKVVDVRKVGQELGVRYVMEGSIQRVPDRIRINVQLIEAASGRHLWSERYDRPAADIFEVQDDITHRIVTELDVALLHGEEARVWRRSTQSREAYELYLRAREHYDRYTKEDIAQSQTLLGRALEIDPKFTIALVWLGWTYYIQADSGWSSNSAASYERAVAFGRRAVQIDDSLADAYSMIGNVLLSLRRNSDAMIEFKRALEVGPNSADNLLLVGYGYAPNGKAAEAKVLIDRAFRLNPFPPPYWYGALGDALLFGKRPAEAIPFHRKCVDSIPDFIWCQFGLTVALAQTGKIDEARTQAKEVLRVNKDATAAENSYVAAIGDPAERQAIIELLRKAGLK